MAAKIRVSRRRAAPHLVARNLILDFLQVRPHLGGVSLCEHFGDKNFVAELPLAAYLVEDTLGRLGGDRGFIGVDVDGVAHDTALFVQGTGCDEFLVVAVDVV